MTSLSSQRDGQQQLPKLQKVKKFFSFLRPSLFGISLFSSKKQRDSPVLHSFNDGIDLLSKLTIKDISISEKELTEFISSAQELALKLPGAQVVLRCEELLIKQINSYQQKQEFQLWQCISVQKQDNSFKTIEDQIANCESQHTLQALSLVFNWNRQFYQQFSKLLEGSNLSNNSQASRIVAWKYLLNLLEGLSQPQILLFLQNVVGDIVQQMQKIYTEKYQPLPEESLACFEILEQIGCITSLELNLRYLSNTTCSNKTSQIFSSGLYCLREMDFCTDQTLSQFIKVLLFQVALKNITVVSSERSAIVLLSTYAWFQDQEDNQINIIQHLVNILEQFEGSDFDKTRVSQQLRLFLSKASLPLIAKKLLLSCKSIKEFLSFTPFSINDNSLKLKNGLPTKIIIPSRNSYSQFIETVLESSVIHIALALNEEPHSNINLNVIFHGSTNISLKNNLQNGQEKTIFHKQINSPGINRFNVIAEHQGMYSVVLNNKHSIFRSKQVTFRIHLLTPENIIGQNSMTKILFPNIKQDQLNNGSNLQNELDLSDDCLHRIVLHFHEKQLSVYSAKLEEITQQNSSESSLIKKTSTGSQLKQFNNLKTMSDFEIDTDLEANIIPIIESIVNNQYIITDVPSFTTNQQSLLEILKPITATTSIPKKQTSIALFVVLEDINPQEVVLFNKESLFYLMLKHSYPNINVFVHFEPQLQLNAFLIQHNELYSQINSFFWLSQGNMYYSINNKLIQKYQPIQQQIQLQSQQQWSTLPQQINPDCDLEFFQKVLLLLDSQENRFIVAKKPSIIKILDMEVEDTWEYSIFSFQFDFTSSIFFNEK